MNPFEGSHYSNTDMLDALMNTLDLLTKKRQSYKTDLQSQRGSQFAMSAAPQRTSDELNSDNTFARGTSTAGSDPNLVFTHLGQ